MCELVLIHFKRIFAILMVALITLAYPSAIWSFAEGEETAAPEQEQLELNAEEDSAKSEDKASPTKKSVSRREFQKIDVKIYWDDNYEAETRPEKLEVELYKVNNPDEVVDTLTLTKENKDKNNDWRWNGSFKDIPVFDSNEEYIEYRYRLKEVPTDYNVEERHDGFNLSYTKTALIIYKRWQDYGFESHRPSNISFEVYDMNDTSSPLETKTFESAPRDKYEQKIVITGLEQPNSDNNWIEYGIKEVLDTDEYMCYLDRHYDDGGYRKLGLSVAKDSTESTIVSGTEFDAYNSYVNGGHYLSISERIRNMVPTNASDTLDFVAEFSNLKPNETYTYLTGQDNPSSTPKISTFSSDSTGKAKVEFSLKNREGAYFVNLPESYKYNVTQKKNSYMGDLYGPDIQIVKESLEDVLTTGEKEATENVHLEFTNYISSTGVAISKYVDSGRPDDEFTFEVELNNLEPNKTYTGFKFKFNAMPLDEKLLLKAIVMPDESNEQFKIIDNISITADANGHWAGTIKLKNNEVWYLEDIADTATARVIEKAAKDYISSLEIYGNSPETITKANEEPNLDLDSGVVSAVPNRILRFAFTNSAENGNLYLDKKVDGMRINPDDEFTFIVRLSGLTPGETYEYTKGKSFDDFEVTRPWYPPVELNSINDRLLKLKNVPSFTADENGNAEVEITLKQDEGIIFKNLPEGYSYEITEKWNSSYEPYAVAYKINMNGGISEDWNTGRSHDYDGYTIDSNGNVRSNNTLVRFSNYSRLHNVYVGKTQVGGDLNDIFDYKLEAGNLQPNQTYNYFFTDAKTARLEEGINGTRYEDDSELTPNPPVSEMSSFTTDENGFADVDFQLKGGQVAVFLLPENSQYRVTELDTKDYTALVTTTTYSTDGGGEVARLALQSAVSEKIWRPEYEEEAPKYQLNNLYDPISWPKHGIASTSMYYNSQHIGGYDTIRHYGEDYIEFKNISDNRILTLDKKVVGNNSDNSAYTFDIDIEGLTPNETSVVRTETTPEKDNIPAVQDDTEYVTLTYDPNGGTGSPVQMKVPKGSAAMIQDSMFTKSGEMFKCWKDANDREYYPYDSMNIRKDTTLYAQWGSGLKLNYNIPDELKSPYEIKPIRTYWESYTLPSRDMYAYTLKSWNTKADGSGTNYDVGYQWTPESGCLTLYAQWERIPDTYTITVNENYGKNRTYPVCAKHEGEAIGSFPIGRRIGYRIASFNTKADGSGETYNSDTPMPAHDITLYAQWVKGGTIKKTPSPSLKSIGAPSLNLKAEAQANPTEIVADENGKYHGTFTLKNGERLTLIIPQGCTYKITEKANGCVASYEIKEYEGSVVASKENTADNTDLATDVMTLNNNTNTTFTNTWINVAPPTGQEKTSLLLIGVCACLGVALALLLKTIQTKKTV